MLTTMPSLTRNGYVFYVIAAIALSGLTVVGIFYNNTSSKIPSIKPLVLDKNLLQMSLRQSTTPENITRLPLCPESPPNLKSNVQTEVYWKAYVENPSVLQHVQRGGLYRPPDCRPREHVAIVVPMRDRQEHLNRLVVHLHQFLPKQKISYRIFVAEMTQGTTFNTGIMQNVGFITGDKAGNFTCFIIHDVDLLPTNENNLYKCDNVPLHMANNNSKFNYQQLYDGYFGGVIAVTRNMYYKANGYSNLYFGWGGQDDDFRARLVHVGFVPRHIEMHIGVYEALHHDQDAANPPNPIRMNLLSNATGIMKEDGLSNIQYKLLKYEERELYTWVLVEVNRTKVMAKFQQYN